MYTLSTGNGSIKILLTNLLFPVESLNRVTGVKYSGKSGEDFGNRAG